MKIRLMNTKLIFILALACTIGFVLWCYYPHKDAGTIAFKMRVPFPGLYSRCVSQLGETGTPEAIEILLRDLHGDNRDRRIGAAKALGKTEWRPSDEKERALYFVAAGRYQDAADMGSAGIEPLIEEFGQVEQAVVRSRLCAVLLKTGDSRALKAIEEYLRKKLDKIGAVVKEALPAGTRINTTIEEVSPRARRIVIAGHLLEGVGSDNTSPHIRGDYTNRERLEAKARQRTFEIYRTIFRDIPMTEFHSVVVQCRHGVRVKVTTYGALDIPWQGGTDEAMTIFETSITPETAQKLNWENATVTDLEKAWTVEKDIIPSLEFSAVFGGFR